MPDKSPEDLQKDILKASDQRGKVDRPATEHAHRSAEAERLMGR